MRQCLTSPQGGYYTTTRSESSSDQFGRQGDFITSPEISQVFGELVGIWFVTEWMAQGRSGSGVQLIEVGPGRGTLMDDMLRTISTFNGFAASIDGVYLVEAGEALREKQRRVLCGDGEGKAMVKTEMGWKCVSKYRDIPVVWVEDINLLPKDEAKEKMPFIIAHEFFDALPVHAFESVAVGASPSAQERQDSETKTSPLVDSAGKPLLSTSPSSSTSSTTSSTASTATTTITHWRELLVTPTPKPFHPSQLSTQKESEATPDFQLTLSKSATPTSLLLPESSPRYKALKPHVGSSLEISPDSLRHVGEFARRIGGSQTSNHNEKPQPQRCNSIHPSPSGGGGRGPSGAALIIDYGPASTIPLNSLRGIQTHKRVSPFTGPGTVDLSADVDFTALAEAALAASPGVEVWGPVEQGDFLAGMGGQSRIEQLIEGLERGGGRGRGGEEEERKKEGKKKILLGSWRRLVEKGGPQAMGRIYKALAVVPEGGGRRAPVGFGGRVDGAE